MSVRATIVGDNDLTPEEATAIRESLDALHPEHTPSTTRDIVGQAQQETALTIAQTLERRAHDSWMHGRLHEAVALNSASIAVRHQYDLPQVKAHDADFPEG